MKSQVSLISVHYAFPEPEQALPTRHGDDQYLIQLFHNTEMCMILVLDAPNPNENKLLLALDMPSFA